MPNPTSHLPKPAKWPAILALAGYALYLTYSVTSGRVLSPGTVGAWGLVLILGGIAVGRKPGAFLGTAYSFLLMLYLFWMVPEQFNLPSFLAGMVSYLAIGIGGGWVMEVLLAQRDQISIMQRRAEEDALYFRTALSSIADGVIATDGEGNLTFMNAAASALTGWPMEEALGRPVSEVLDAVNEVSGQTVIDVVRRVLEERPVSLSEEDMTLISQDGRSITLEAEAAPILDRDLGTGGIIMTFRDVTERRRADDALRRSESLNRSMLEAMPDIVIRVSRDGIYRDVITRDDSKLYLPAEQLVGRRITDLLPAEPAKRNLEAIDRALETGVMQVAEYPLSVMEGDRHFEARVVPSGEDEAIAVIRDITDSRNTQVALSESERQFRLLAENSPDLIYRIVLKPRPRFDYVSPSSQEFVGYTPQQHYDDPELALKLVHPDDVDKLMSLIDPTHDFDEAVIIRLVRRDGSVIWTEHQVTPIYDEVGDLQALEGFARDVTERKRMEDELRHLSMHDQLTGLHNRRYFEAEMQRLNVARQLPLSLVVCDVNGLKQVNDIKGHLEGDRLLQQMASLIREAVRQEDIVARWGGDEFLIILPQTSLTRAEEIGSAIGEAAERIETGSVRVGLAVGWATKEDVGEDLEGVLRAAEEMMYWRKRAAKASSGDSAEDPAEIASTGSRVESD